jgi:branched-chain amino acid transport system permease protein
MDFLPFTLNLLSTAAVYGLFGLAVVFAYRMSRILFMCVGEIGMVSAYVFTFTWREFGGGGLWIAILAAFAAAAAIGSLLCIAIRAEHRRDPFVGTVITIAGSIVLLGLMTVIWGGTVEQVPVVNSRIGWGGAELSSSSLIALVAGSGTLAATLLLFYRTSFGIGLQALAANRKLARLSGLAVTRYEFLTWIGASLLSGIAGILFAFTSAVSVDGAVVGFSGMIAAIIGGLTSPLGALAGAVLLALGEQWIGLYFDIRYAVVVPVLALTLLLILRPRGLSARTETIERT